MDALEAAGPIPREADAAYEAAVSRCFDELGLLVHLAVATPTSTPPQGAAALLGVWLARDRWIMGGGEDGELARQVVQSALTTLRRAGERP